MILNREFQRHDFSCYFKSVTVPGSEYRQLGYDQIRKEGGTLPHDVDANSFLHVLLYLHIV